MKSHSSFPFVRSIFVSLLLGSVLSAGPAFAADCGKVDVAPWPHEVLVFEIDEAHCEVVYLDVSGTPVESVTVRVQGEEDDEIEIPPGATLG